MTVSNIGALLFGVVIGWIAYRTLVRQTTAVNVSDLATVLGTVGGGAVLAIFKNQHQFGLYAIGLAVGFFAYLVVFAKLNGRSEVKTRMGGDTHPLNLD